MERAYHQVALKLIEICPYLVFTAKKAFLELVLLCYKKQTRENKNEEGRRGEQGGRGRGGEGGEGGEPKDSEIEVLMNAIVNGYDYMVHKEGFFGHSWNVLCDILTLEVPLPFFMASIVLLPCIGWGDVSYIQSEGTHETWAPVPKLLVNILSEHKDPLISQPALLAQFSRQMKMPSLNAPKRDPRRERANVKKTKEWPHE